MSNNMNRRSFLKRIGAAAAVGGATGLAQAAPVQLRRAGRVEYTALGDPA